MKNLTTVQEKLVNDLINQFEKLNPKPTTSEGKRFGINTISEVLNEEQRLKDTMKKYNKTMMEVFIKQFDLELKNFKKEFGKLFDIQLGIPKYPHNPHDKEMWVNGSAKDISNGWNELYLFIVSKTKIYGGDSNSNFCNNKAYLGIYIDFRKETYHEKLETGKEIRMTKVVGLEYRIHSYLNKERGTIYNSLDELIQKEKFVQQRLVELSK